MNTATFDESCASMIDHRLLVTPITGWGWVGRQPSPFRMVLCAMERNDLQALRGGYGKIEQQDHVYDGLFVVFKPHYQGTWNFTTNIGEHNLYLYPALPPEWKRMVTRFKASEIPQGYTAGGYGRIAVEP